LDINLKTSKNQNQSAIESFELN